VRAVGGGGGTYGVRLDLVSPTAGEPEAAPVPASVERGPVPGVPHAVRANAGDVLLVYVPKTSAYDPHELQVRRDDAWVSVPREAISEHGERAAVRTPEDAAIVGFRPQVPGEFRYVPIAPEPAPVLRVYPAEEAGGAPLLLGTGLDPQVLARSASAWRTIGIGLVMPGFDYLFVAAGSGPRDLGMRVRALSGAVAAQRGGGSFAPTEVAGVGPSLRFRVKEPQAVRLEVRGSGWRGYALLRRASN
jgi:hypothetical protein